MANYMELLVDKYKLDKDIIKKAIENYDENQGVLTVMEQIGRKRGALVSGGRVDNAKVANIVLQDFREARIGKITLEKVKR